MSLWIEEFESLCHQLNHRKGAQLNTILVKRDGTSSHTIALRKSQRSFLLARLSTEIGIGRRALIGCVLLVLSCDMYLHMCAERIKTPRADAIILLMLLVTFFFFLRLAFVE